MFKNWVRGFRKDDENLDVGEKEVVEQPAYQDESKEIITQKDDTQKHLVSDFTQQDQTGHEKVEIAENLKAPGTTRILSKLFLWEHLF